ncbi:MAG TPA: MoaD/ThiS family protein [Gallionella sp.]|nr:MoaD/ThiS family protein [Gallionella sp.]
MIRVLFFGPIAERIGARETVVEFHAGMRVQDMRDELAARYPQAFEIICFTAVNGEHVRDLSLPLTDDSEVAFMARFSGG